jgi:NAD(P)-dependent dehydrogenase (short-subunit alcohol dehydrogenase family)
MTTWLITGTSSGLGRALAEEVLAAGHRVVATARDTDDVQDLVDRYPQDAAAVRLDVTDPESVQQALRRAHEAFGGVDVLVNNAGYGYVAAVEEGEPEAVDRLFATNVFGPAALIRAVLPSMRAAGAGTIVNVSSVGARTTIPGGGYYSAAKAALEGLSGSLRREVEQFGVRVVVVEPGSFRTDFRGRSAQRSEVVIEAYDAVLGRDGGGGLSPQRGEPANAARAILQVVQDPRPPQLLLLGSDALEGYRARTQAEAEDVERFEELTLSTDAD